MLSGEQVASFLRDGFVVVPGLFTTDEVKAFQRSGREALPGPGTVELFSIPALSDLWLDHRLLSIAADLLKRPLAYFFEANFSRYVFSPGEHIRGRHIHHDAKGTSDNLFSRDHRPAPYFPAVRLAIYFQDTATESGGLKVVPGSHLMDTSDFDEVALTYHNVRSTPGDLVCFSPRLLHSPFALRRIGQPDLALSPRMEDLAFIKMPQKFVAAPAERETLFIDYATRDERSDLLIKSRAAHPDNRKRGVGRAIAESNWLEIAGQHRVDLRLDYALVEAATDRTEATPEVLASSRGWTPHFDFFDGRAGGAELLPIVAQRIHLFQAMIAQRRRDPHMGALPIDRLR